MNNKLRMVFCLLLLCFSVVLPAMGNRERAVIVRVTGMVRLVGSGTMPELVITGNDMEWYVFKDEEYKLRELQHRIVTVEGSETVHTLTFASGLPAGERRFLKNIRIVSIQ